MVVSNLFSPLLLLLVVLLFLLLLLRLLLLLLLLSRTSPPPPCSSGPLVDAYVDDNLTIWALWARPRGGGGGGAGAFKGGVCSYGNVTLNAVHHHTVDEVGLMCPVCGVGRKAWSAGHGVMEQG